jgi:NAD(P)-dependent dehydrogenase (short-subunit alcohol dehydrogenase family)
MGRLDGKIALVTGAAQGMGYAIVERFLAEGARVVGADLDPSGLAKLASPQLATIKGDSSKGADCNAAAALAAEKFGGLHILVNGVAVIDTPICDVVELSEADWRRAVDVNLTSYFLMSKAAIPLIRKCGGGSIIHIASQLGSVGQKGRAPYNATKAAIINLTRAMALDHARENIRVNSLSPGAVITPRTLGRFQGSADATEKALAPAHPIGRLGRPEELANAALFLASDEASFMTGADMIVDGGYTTQ